MKRKFAPGKYFKTQERLEVALINYDKIDGMEDLLDSNFAHLMFDLDGGRQWDALNGKLFEIPYWITLDYIGSFLLDNQTYDFDKSVAQYVEGCFWSSEYGAMKEIDGKKYKFITTVPLPTEIEHQAEDGECCYEYRGHSFLAIWEEI